MLYSFIIPLPSRFREIFSHQEILQQLKEQNSSDPSIHPPSSPLFANVSDEALSQFAFIFNNPQQFASYIGSFHAETDPVHNNKEGILDYEEDDEHEEIPLEVAEDHIQQNSTNSPFLSTESSQTGGEHLIALDGVILHEEETDEDIDTHSDEESEESIEMEKSALTLQSPDFVDEETLPETHIQQDALKTINPTQTSASAQNKENTHLLSSPLPTPNVPSFNQSSLNQSSVPPSSLNPSTIPFTSVILPAEAELLVHPMSVGTRQLRSSAVLGSDEHRLQRSTRTHATHDAQNAQPHASTHKPPLLIASPHEKKSYNRVSRVFTGCAAHTVARSTQTPLPSVRDGFVVFDRSAVFPSAAAPRERRRRENGFVERSRRVMDVRGYRLTQNTNTEREEKERKSEENAQNERTDSQNSVCDTQCTGIEPDKGDSAHTLHSSRNISARTRRQEQKKESEAAFALLHADFPVFTAHSTDSSH